MSGAHHGLLRRHVLGLPVSPRAVPSVPELWLHLVGESADLDRRLHGAWELERVPYWPFAWAAGQVLARWVLDRPHVVRGRLVVDVGAGSGIVALAAVRAGAARVWAVDRDREALVAVRANAALNDLAVDTSETLPARWDVLLAADILYEPENLSLLCDLVARSGTVLVAAPERRGSVFPDLPRLARVPARTSPDVDAPVDHVRVYGAVRPGVP